MHSNATLTVLCGIGICLYL